MQPTEPSRYSDLLTVIIPKTLKMLTFLRPNLSAHHPMRPTFTCELPVMFPAGLVVADDAHDVLPVLVLRPRRLRVRALLAHVGGGHRGGERSA